MPTIIIVIDTAWVVDIPAMWEVPQWNHEYGGSGYFEPVPGAFYAVSEVSFQLRHSTGSNGVNQSINRGRKQVNMFGARENIVMVNFKHADG